MVTRKIKWAAFLLQILLAATLNFGVSTVAAWPFVSPSANDRILFSSSNSTKLSDRKTKKWTSMLSVDPSQILATLIDRGGLFIPVGAESDLKTLCKFLHVDKAELNVVEKHLILYNFCVGIQGKPHALSIGRVYVHWGSYTQPCLDIEVDDVDVLMDFTNLLLTKNNWNELNQAGFPPRSWESGTTSAEILSFPRFGSIDLSGFITVRLTSRPLQKEIGRFSLDMESTKDLSALIRDLAERNRRAKKGRGCTSSELTTILQTYFSKKVRSFLKDTVYDIANDPKAAMQSADKIITKAGESILNYAGDAGRKTGANIQESIVAKLDDIGLGIPHDKFGALKEKAIYVVRHDVVDTLRQRLGNEWKPKNKKDSSTTTGTQQC